MSVGRGVFWKKTTVEECCRLDMSYLTKKYIMDWDWQTTMSWTSSWGRHDSIGLDICPPDKIRLYYTSTSRSTSRVINLDYYVHYESTPCNYGGKRWWFRCPECDRRCRILYLPPSGDYFACRICHNLSYESQQEGKSRWYWLIKAINEETKLGMKYSRARSPKKKATIQRKIDRIYGGLRGIIAWGNKNK